MRFGIDTLLAEPARRRALAGLRLALLAHPASLTAGLEHSLDALARKRGLRLSAAFGPQHGIRGEKQDNMIESASFVDARHRIPVHSLYGEVRRPSAAMLADCDLVLVDLQDLGCRIYTFATTLCYLIEAAAAAGKGVWVLDRPNPAGRPVEGLLLEPGQESFVGAGPMPMRHGLTLGELGAWYIAHRRLELHYTVVPLSGWRPDAAPGYGWPLGRRAWVNPSPNAPNLWMARCYAGTVLVEGTTLSEGRGTTRPLELFGAPDLDAERLRAEMHALAPEWLAGCALRPCAFEPTFHKHAGRLCAGLEIHVDGPEYRHQHFRPYRLVALAFKAIRRLYPDYPLWREFVYEYERERLAIDVINGGARLRQWVDDAAASPADLERILAADEARWCAEREPHFIYR
jgi:uncharacterized protein YbbC (DUF1343 family)